MKKSNSAIHIIRELISLSDVSETQPPGCTLHSSHSASDRRSIYVKDDNLELFSSKFESVIHLDLFSEKISLKMVGQEFIEQCISNLIIENYYLGHRFDNRNVVEFEKATSIPPAKKTHVVRDIRGIDLHGLEQISVGMFTIYTIERYAEIHPKPFEMHTRFPRDIFSDYVIVVTVSAANFDAALAIADDLFREFVLAFTFLTKSKNSGRAIYIGDNYQVNILRQMVHDDSSSRLSAKHLNKLFNVDFASIDFESKNSSIAKLFSIIGSEVKFHSEILRSVCWIGQAILDQDISSSYVKVVTALEVLLGSSDTAIKDNISTRLAFLIGKSKDDCVRIESLGREVYSHRSKIVHGTNIKTSNSKFQSALSLAIMALEKCLMDDFYFGLSSKEAFHFKIDSMKYSCMAT